MAAETQADETLSTCAVVILVDEEYAGKIMYKGKTKETMREGAGEFVAKNHCGAAYQNESLVSNVRGDAVWQYTIRYSTQDCPDSPNGGSESSDATEKEEEEEE